jgi:hypothetical protein
MVGRSPNLALRLASATCPLKPACSCSFAADTFARPCSSVCSRDAMDQGSGARRRETPRLPVQDGCWTRWTSGAFVDAGRLTHNPEVAGSNPAPATNFRRSRLFSYQEEGLWRFRRVAKHVAATRFRAAWRRDGGDRGHEMRQRGRGGRCRLRSLGVGPRGTRHPPVRSGELGGGCVEFWSRGSSSTTAAPSRAKRFAAARPMLELARAQGRSCCPVGAWMPRLSSAGRQSGQRKGARACVWRRWGH